MLPPECSLKQGLESGKIILVDTSGTTEDKITNIWNQAWWDNAERASWQLNSAVREIATGEHHEAILVNPLNVGIISDEVDLTLDERRTARFLYLNEKTDPLAWSPGLMDRMIEEINLFRPAVLEANPSYLARLCRYITAVRKTVFTRRNLFLLMSIPLNCITGRSARYLISPWSALTAPRKRAMFLCSARRVSCTRTVTTAG